MQYPKDRLECLVRPRKDISGMSSLSPFAPLSDEVCNFLSSLSKVLMSDKDVREMPDVFTFGYFCRIGNLKRLKAQYEGSVESRLGRGVTFHIAPANVPINFAYSLAAGLLAGNACIVRVPSRRFPQVEFVVRAIKKALDTNEGRGLADYIALLRYERDTEITSYLSSLCDIRLIWGGDTSINEIRKSPIPAKSFDLTFSDRYSICLVKASALLGDLDKGKLGRDFFNDTYLFDQNACTSPRLIAWIGSKDEIFRAKEKFWSAVHNYIKPRYSLEAVVAVDKLMTMYRSAVDLKGVMFEQMPDHLINRISVPTLSAELYDYRSPGGYFLEFECDSLAVISPFVSRRVQTLSYFGFDPEFLRSWVVTNRLLGIDRIVPIGMTADFQLSWDGYDLIKHLSRVITS